MKLHSVRRSIVFGLHVLLTLLSVTVCAVGIYIHVGFPGQEIDSLLFYLSESAGSGGGAEAVGKAAVILVPICLAVTALLLTLQYGFRRHPVGRRWVSRRSGKERRLSLLPIRPRWLFTLLSCLLLVGIGLGQIGTFSYLRSNLTLSDFLEIEYVDPSKKGVLTAPDESRNLVYIFLESMETSFFSEEHGGLWDEEIIPELYELLSDPDAIYFATDDQTLGIPNVYGTTWTTGALVGMTCGIPFKVPVGKENSYHSDNFLSGAYALGDVLADNGYRNILVSGPRTAFGGIGDFFSSHGDYTVVEPSSLSFRDSAGGTLQFSVPQEQFSSWGMSDEATFKIAQQVIEAEAASSSGPWHCFIKTVDAHFSGYLFESGDGYEGSVNTHDSKVENVYATTSREVGKFVSWLKSQSFYENTTIVIVGDHPNMLSGICGDVAADERGRYNLILNSVVSTDNTKNRLCTVADLYPTVLAAMGFRIRGNRLGIGVDLFSSSATLAELYGIQKLNEELQKRSDFYIDRIMGRRDYEQLEG